MLCYLDKLGKTNAFVHSYSNIQLQQRFKNIWAYHAQRIVFYLKSWRTTGAAHPLCHYAIEQKYLLTLDLNLVMSYTSGKKLSEITPENRGRTDEQHQETFNSTLADRNWILVSLRGLSSSSLSIKGRWNAILKFC